MRLFKAPPPQVFAPTAPAVLEVDPKPAPNAIVASDQFVQSALTVDPLVQRRQQLDACREFLLILEGDAGLRANLAAVQHEIVLATLPGSARDSRVKDEIVVSGRGLKLRRSVIRRDSCGDEYVKTTDKSFSVNAPGGWFGFFFTPFTWTFDHLIAQWPKDLTREQMKANFEAGLAVLAPPKALAHEAPDPTK